MATYLDELVQKITTKADLKGFDELDKKQKRARKENNLLARSFRNAFGIFLSIQGVRSIVEVSRKFDLMQKSLSGLTKSAEDFKYLRNEAYRTGNDLLTISTAYKNFYASASGVGFNRNAIQSMFSDVLVAGRGIGASQQQLSSALTALEQMLSKGKVSTQELRLQLGNALPGAMQIASRSMNMTTAELDKMISSGMLVSSVFVPRFTAQLKKELGGGFEQATQSLDFALVNLSTAWQEFQATVLQGEAGTSIADVVKELTNLLKSQGALSTVRLIGNALSVVIKNLKLILVIFGVTKVLQYVIALRKLHLTILAMATSTKALGVHTRTLAIAYQMLTSGQILTGLKMMQAGLVSMLAPVMRLSTAIAGLVSWLLIAQDLLMFLTDPNSETVTGQIKEEAGYSNGMRQNYGVQTVQGLSEEEKNAYERKLRMQGLNPRFMKNRDGSYQLMDMYNPTGLDERLTPSIAPSGFTPMPNNYTGNYSNSSNNKQNNTISINVYPQQGQSEEAIGDAVAIKLGNILDNYVMVS